MNPQRARPDTAALAGAIRPPRKARMAALDLDGTLIGPDLEFGHGVRDTIREALDRGVHVVIATGRAFRSASHFHNMLGLTTPLVAYQGAIVSEADGTPWLETRLPPGAAHELASFAEEHSHELTFYARDRVYLLGEPREQPFYDTWFGLPRQHVARWADVDETPVKALLIANDRDHGDELQSAWTRRFAPGLNVIRSHELFVEVVSPQADKGRAVEQVALRLGVARSDVLAVGDADNDAPMLAWAGCGVAVGDATPLAIASADVVAPSFADGGAAWALRRYALGEDV